MAGPTGVIVSETLMAPEVASAAIDYTPVIHDLLTVMVDGRRRPRKLHAMVRDSDATLTYPPLVLVAVNGDEEGLLLEFVGPLWHLGSGGIGPMILDREYVSGADKLDNGTFLLDGLYWRRASEGGLWVLLAGNATNVGGLDADDVLESERKFPTRPGHAYRVRAEGVSGTGRLRLRTIYDGQFHPANLWPNGDLAAGATSWTGSAYAAVVNDPANAYGASGNVIRCLPIPKASWSDNFESGGGWTDVTTPAPMSDDIDIVNDPSQAADGSWVLRVGPVTQHQVLTNADYGAGLDYWHPSSTDSDPHAVWAVAVGGGNNGSDGVRTTGWSTAGRTGPEVTKYLRADSENGSGAATYDVSPGENYRVEAYLRGQPGTDGRASVSVMIPHPTVPGHDEWRHSEELEAPPNDVDQWVAVSIENVTIPANRFDLNALCQVWDHTLGHWDLDTFSVTRTRGNRAKIVSDTLIPVEVDTDYEVAALMRNGDDMQVGNVRVGVELLGAGVDTESEGEDKGSTDFVWDRAARVVRPAAGYTHARFFVAAQDVIGSMWVDNFTLTQLNNNRTTITGSTFPLTPERSYTVACKFHSPVETKRGNIRIDVRLTRAGYPDVVVPSAVQDITAGERRLLEFTVTPPSGYATGQASVTFTDVEGGNFYAGAFKVVDNDTQTVVYDTTMDNPTAGGANVDTVAPEGAEFVRVAVIAEQGTTGWTVGSVSLARTGVTPATGNAIVADLLTDPETDDPLSIVAGAVNCPEVIPYDWVIQNMPNRDALDHYASVVSEPTREYRVLATDPPSIDVGTRADVFTVHEPADALLPEDRDVEELSNPETNVEGRATEIEVIGAEVQTVSGRPFLITATAAVPGPVEYDYNDRPIVRTKQVHDGTVDHRGYAQALGDDLAGREAEPPIVVTVKLSGTGKDPITGERIRPDFKSGDTLYAFHPESGLEDPTNTVTIEGATVRPRAVRVLVRERSLGPSYSVTMRRSDGTTFVLPGVRWADEDATVLTVGDRLPEWMADPQGQAEGIQYLRDRASRPR